MTPKTQKLWFLLQVNNLNIFLKEMCQKSKMDTTIDFVKHPKHSRINIFLNIFVPKIWNRGIITLVVQTTEQNETLKTKVLPNFKIFEKIKQVSSTKLTNWYKTSVVEK